MQRQAMTPEQQRTTKLALSSLMLFMMQSVRTVDALFDLAASHALTSEDAGACLTGLKHIETTQHNAAFFIAALAEAYPELDIAAEAAEINDKANAFCATVNARGAELCDELMAYYGETPPADASPAMPADSAAAALDFLKSIGGTVSDTDPETPPPTII